MTTLSGSVGTGRLNQPADVTRVQDLLANHTHWLAPIPLTPADGHCGPDTIEAIKRFQETAAALEKGKVDGVVTPSGFTLKRLEIGYIPKPKHRVFDNVCWAHAANELTLTLLQAAAKTLALESEAIEAVVEQEVAIRGPWDEFGRPTILYERHLFRHFTKKKWNLTHPDISGPQGGYGRYSAQYPKLYRAATLDEPAALKSASWGAFQILGENFADCGYTSVETFVDAMLANETNQLNAFVAFVNKNSTLKKALKDKDWTTFARIYNGPDYQKNHYDTNISNIYNNLINAKGVRK